MQANNQSINMVQMCTAFLGTCLILQNFYCCPGEASRTASSTVHDTSSVQTTVHPDSQATAFRKNAAAVTAVIDSVSPAGETGYRVYCRLSKVESIQSMPVFVQEGESIVLEPDFELLPSGEPDTTNLRNQRLISVRTARPGTMISGTISLHEKGRWYLLDLTPGK